ncbi:hypothetical protein PTKIN_Ptkin02bG0188800 [Pterospermum kingtungense]
MIKEANPDVNYQFMKSNVDKLNIIQLGLTFSDSEDYYDKSSIELLEQQGIDFSENRWMGVDSRDFCLRFWNSGLYSYFNKMTWITLHGAYDFAYLMKILAQKPLPCNLQSFMEKLVLLFGYEVFDIKHASKLFDLHGGLDKVAKTLNVARVVGSIHQSGSDSLLTLQCFMELKKLMAFEEDQCMPSQIMLALAFHGLLQGIDASRNHACNCCAHSVSGIWVTNSGIPIVYEANVSSIADTVIIYPLKLY